MTLGVFTAYFDVTGLIAGDKQPIHRYVQIKQGQVIPRGTLLGRARNGTATSAVKASGANTGTGTLTMDATTPTVGNDREGVYTVRFTAATTFNVFDPLGDSLGSGVVGTAFNDQIKFNTAAGGTAFVAGDGFDITMAADDRYVASVKTATDGTGTPDAIMAADIDTTNGDARAPVYTEGEFAFEKMAVDASWSFLTLEATLRKNNSPLIIRSLGVYA